MSYKDTFIRVAADCPATSSVVPSAKGESKPLHLIQYELLANHPYTYTHEDLIYEVHVRHKAIPEEEIKARGAEIRAELFQKSHPCLRASMLPKKYGWGVHYDQQGRIALYGMESEEYRQFTEAGDGGPTLLNAMRNKRA
jgi:hypothetical protein